MEVNLQGFLKSGSKIMCPLWIDVGYMMCPQYGVSAIERFDCINVNINVSEEINRSDISLPSKYPLMNLVETHYWTWKATSLLLLSLLCYGWCTLVS